MDINNNLGAVIVTYFPDFKELKLNISKYYKAFDTIVVVDNGTKDFDYIELIGFKNLEIIYLPKNEGIAKAQNIGIEYLLKKSIDYLVFFDQDSSMNDEECRVLLKTFELDKKIGLVGPTINNKSLEIKEVSETLSSGSIIPKRVILDVGLMNEELFIDLVDYEWCWRAKKAGYKIIVNEQVFLNHMLGEGKKGFLGIPQPFRHYYQFRNTIYMMSTDVSPIKFKIKYFFTLPIKYIFFSFIAEDRKLRKKFIKRGIKDGFQRKLGYME